MAEDNRSAQSNRKVMAEIYASISGTVIGAIGGGIVAPPIYVPALFEFFNQYVPDSLFTSKDAVSLGIQGCTYLAFAVVTAVIGGGVGGSLGKVIVDRFYPDKV